jgi:large subunit ribosomal protein L23
MAILDFFKKKFKEDKSSSRTELPQGAKVKKKASPSLPPSPSKEGSEKAEKKEVKKRPEVKRVEKEKKKEKKKISKIAPRVLKEAHITEKATELTKENQYLFKVYPQANKKQIKKAVEELYGVKVTGVRIINIPKKPRRLGRISGFKKGYKKAIVAIKKGEKIEIMPR